MTIRPSSLPARRSARRVAAATSLAVVGLLSACASTQLDAQWVDAQVGVNSNILRGAKVLVACDAADLVVRQICTDQLARDVSARGAMPVFAPGDTALTNDRSVDAQLLPAARQAGAKAMMIMTIAPAVTDVSPGFQLGIGGFGFGRHSAGGVGVSAPIGGGRVETGYSANGRVSDTTDGRLLWTARASAPPSSDIDGQMTELSRLVVDAAGKVGLF